jgi:hypothetical protein
MSWTQSFWAGQGKDGKVNSLPDNFRAKYPTLAEVFEGSAPGTKENPAAPSCSVILFLEGSQLKFCLSPKVGNRIAFGCIGQPLEALECLESELLAGHFEWKVSRR